MDQRRYLIILKLYKNSMDVAHIALPIPFFHTFDYFLPQNMFTQAGCRVIVPFGKKKYIGIVISVSNQSTLPLNALKNVIEILDEKPVFSPNIWRLLLWAADYYHQPIGKVLFYSLPDSLRRGKRFSSKPMNDCFVTKEWESSDVNNLNKSQNQKQTLMFLHQHKIWQYQTSKFELSKNVSQTLCKKKLNNLINAPNLFQAWQGKFGKLQQESNTKASILFAIKQKIAVNAICSTCNIFSAWLLSGNNRLSRTDVYLSTIKNILHHNKQALIIVPETNIILQIVARLHQHFNVSIGILHSKLSSKQYLNTWLKAKNGEVAIIIGTRSSLFTPFKKLGIIIIEEEHDKSYKQQANWCYNARDLAVYRAYIEYIPIILSSATPALETLHNVHSNKYRMIYLKSCDDDNCQKFNTTLVDLKNQPMQIGLVPQLINRMRQHLQQGNQVILLLNRRRSAQVLMCHNCGWIDKCKQCGDDHNYKFCQFGHSLCFNYCKKQNVTQHKCKLCSSTHFSTVGLGTEKMEQELLKLFPNIPLSRIDGDTIKCKRDLEQQIAEIRLGGARILIGTQMLVKESSYFSKVTLVIILDVDAILFSAHFRAVEYFAQLYTQVINCLWHAGKQCEIVLQTYRPEHPLLQILLSRGYIAFAEQALVERNVLQLPPWTNQIIVRAEDCDNQKAPLFLQRLRNLLETHQIMDNKLWIIGPVQDFSPKHSNSYRWRILFQHQNRIYLQHIIGKVISLINTLPESRKIKWNIDVDPIEK